MTFKYQVIDSKGGIHNRTSAAERVYTHAVVTFYKKRVTAHGTEYAPTTVVSYCGNRQLAEAQQRSIQNRHTASEYIESVEIVQVMRVLSITVTLS